MIKTRRVPNRLLGALKELSPERMRAAMDFVEFLKNKDEEWDATSEILGDASTMRDISAAKADIAKIGRKGMTSWRKIQRYV